MYPLPADFDVSVFSGATLSLVSYSSNSIHLAFDAPERLAITAECPIVHDRGEHCVVVDQAPVVVSGVMRLIGRRVVHAAAPSTVDLELVFDDGQTLRFAGDSDMYEMYRITVGEREIVV